MRVSTLLLTMLLVSSMLPGGSRVVHATVIYADDFESWTVGSYPAPPWQNMFSGMSAFISDAQAHSGSNSFRSESFSGWARWDFVQMASIPNFVEYRGAVMLETAGRGCLLGFGYQEPGAPNTGWAGNSVAFSNDGVIRFYSRGLPAPELGPWEPGRWYDVHVLINYLTLQADVYIDDVLVGNDLQASPKIVPGYGVPVPLDKFGFFGDNFPGMGTSVHFLDNVMLSGSMRVPVHFDIKPTSCPNPLNARSQGVLPAALLGTENFDVSAVDLTTLLLEGSVAPLRTSSEDVATPAGNSECECTRDGPDGFLDLTLKFRTQSVLEVLGPLAPGEQRTLTLTGNLLDGTPFSGLDCVILKGVLPTILDGDPADPEDPTWSAVKQLYR